MERPTATKTARLAWLTLLLMNMMPTNIPSQITLIPSI